MPAEPIWISEHEVASLVDLGTAIDTVEDAFRAESAGTVSTMEKAHLAWNGRHTLHAIGAVDEVHDLVATKTWAHTEGGATPLLIVWSAHTGELRAVIEAFALGQLRTSAVSGVATRWLAQPDANRFAIIGSGAQALAQAAAVVAVRPIEHVCVFSPTLDHRLDFARRLGDLDLGCTVEVADSVERAVAGAHVVTTATRARVPFLSAGMLAPGTHINAIGAITPERRELDVDIVSRADVVVVADNVAVARRLSVELESVGAITRLCDVVAAGRLPGATHHLSVFKAMGVGLADLAIAAEVLTRSQASGLGRPFAAPQRSVPQLKER